MSLRRFASPRLVVAIICVTVFLSHPQTVGAAAPCAIANFGRDHVLTVAARGEPGMTLTVDWGDGTEAISQPMQQSRRNVRLRHRYVAAGEYFVRIEMSGPTGACIFQGTMEIPFDLVVLDSASDLLTLDDHETEIDDTASVRLASGPRPQATQSGLEKSPKPETRADATRPLEQIGALIENLFRWFGRGR